MQSIIKMQIWQFLLVYLLLIAVLFIMKRCRIKQNRYLIIASFRMTIQLMIAGLVLTYIFKNPHPLFTIGYILAMVGFATHRVISKNSDISRRFKVIVFLSLGLCGVCVMVFFVAVVVGASVFNPQYMIPLGGMIMGNAMTGVSIGVKTFRENISLQKQQIETMLNIGTAPQKAIMPLVNQSLETALIPTINSMVGMGIVALPGMMTGQILSGTLPTTAIMYQIAIMIAVCTVVCLSVFFSLYFGSRTFYNSRNQIMF